MCQKKKQQQTSAALSAHRSQTDSPAPNEYYSLCINNKQTRTLASFKYIVCILCTFYIVYCGKLLQLKNFIAWCKSVHMTNKHLES